MADHTYVYDIMTVSDHCRNATMELVEIGIIFQKEHLQ